MLFRLTMNSVRSYAMSNVRFDILGSSVRDKEYTNITKESLLLLQQTNFHEINN